MALKLVSYPELKTDFGIEDSPTQLRKKEALGEFPLRVKRGHHTIAWIEGELREYIEQLAAARDLATAPGRFSKKQPKSISR